MRNLKIKTFSDGWYKKYKTKKEKMGVTFWTFGVEHYELEENMVQYKKNCESPKF